jgi:1-acyl-sn-glycerol-3-phosphate acyltransferase
MAKLPRLSFPYSAPTVPRGVDPVDRPVRSGPDYDTAWARRFPARMGRVLVRDVLMRPIVQALAAPTLEGLDRLDALDRDRPIIFAANHHSHVDTPVLFCSIPESWRDRLFVAAAADYFFRTPVTSAVSALAIGAIPFERGKIGRRSADQAAGLVDEGWSMLIYPEGGRSPDGWGQPFRGGAAYLAQRCDVAVVPVHIQGTSRIMPKGKRLPSPSTSTVTFGSPIEPGEGDDARRLADRIEQAVAELADEATTDWWSARRRAHTGATPSLTGPEAANWRRAWALGEPSRTRRRQRRRWPNL